MTTNDYQVLERINMKFGTTITVSAILLAAATFSPTALADRTVSCESHHHQYNHCNIDTHGYVRLKKQTSRSACVQGQSWDYDKRGIWVDDNCSGRFVVESRHHTSNHEDHGDGSTAGAIAAVAAIALIAAATSSSDDKHDHYNDNDYGRGGHSSYVPSWMVGDFSGYNLQYGSQVGMHVSSDGRVRARVNGTKLTGYVNDERLYVGDAEFYIDRAGDGFNTVQVGDNSNQVHYSRN
jgi:hypothetical protein